MPDNLPAQSAKARLGKVVGGSAAAALLIALVAGFEGKANDPYRDIVGVWTICYGETHAQMRYYTDAECSDMLADSLGDYAEAVLARAPALRDHPNQLAAATSFTYNIGVGNFRKSTAAKRFAAGDLEGGCAAILPWDHAGGKKVKGLTRRRQAEYKICVTGLGALQ